MFNFRKNKNLSGQSLMETIIAVGLVMTVVISSMTMGIYVTRLGRGSQNNLLAVNLAREGIEVVRNIRDSNWLKKSEGVVYKVGDPNEYYQWDTGLDYCKDNYCIVRPEFVTDSLSNLVFAKWSLLDINSTDINGAVCPDKYDNTCRLKRAIGINTYSVDDFHLYNHRATNSTRNIATDFYRGLSISDRDADGGRTVTSTVNWKENSLDKTITLEEYLTDWRYE